MRSKLFCRQSDPLALWGGLHSVEACCERLRGVAGSLEHLLDTGISPEGSDSSAQPAVTIREALSGVLAASEELAACASVIEATANGFAPGLASEARRWSSQSREHYPELLDLTVPPVAPEHDDPGAADIRRVLERCRRQIATVKDRYTILLPGLPWVGPAREEFTGRRLTQLRSHLESASEAIARALSPTEVLVPGVA